MKNYIPHFIHENYQNNNLKGNFETYSIFVDISGFTSLTESLMKYQKEGAEVISSVLNDIFEPVVETVYKNNGFITTFAGDAFTALFMKEKADFSNVVTSSLLIQNFFDNNGTVTTPFGDFDLKVKIGVSEGEVNWGIIGSQDLRTYFFRGKSIDGSCNSEQQASKGEIILDDRVIDKVKEIKGLFYEKKSEFHYLLKREGVSLETNKDSGTLIKLEKEDMLPFVFEGVLDFVGKGEFREITSVFISFDDPNNINILSEFTDKVVSLTTKYSGYFNKLDFGDKGGVILILFGAPISYENNSLRALDFLQNLREESNIEVSWRAGVTEGSVYAGIIGGKERCEYTAIGDVVNLSARLMMKANYGDILISDKVCKKISSIYKCHSIGFHKLKGISEDVNILKVDKKSEILDETSGYETTFIGREEKFSYLLDCVKPLFENRFSGIVHIFGEAGVGKSRFVWELRNKFIDPSFDKDIIWHRCRCDDILKQSFNPFLYFLRFFFEQSPSDSIEVRKKKFDTKLNCLSEHIKDKKVKDELLRTSSILAGYLGIVIPGSLYEMLDARSRYENFLFAVRNLIIAESLMKPVVIEIVDMHHLDEDSEVLLDLITSNMDKYPIFVITHSRYLDDGSKYIPEIENESNTKIIELGFFDRAMTGEMISKIVLKSKKGKISDKLADYIFEKTSGNPFFIEQLLYYLLDKKMLSDDGGELHLVNKDLADIPTNVRSVLISRLDRLASDVRKVVQTGAVLGREFISDILKGILSDIEEIEARIKEAKYEKIWSDLLNSKLIFRSVLLRDTAYDMQLRSELRNIHKFAAQIMEDTFKNTPDEYLGDIAYHYHKAEDKIKAAYYFEKAGNYAKDNYKNSEAIKYYDKLLTYYPLKDNFSKEKRIQNINIKKHSETILKKAEILQLTGEWKEAEELFLKSIEYSERIDDKKLIRESNHLYANQCFRKGDYKEAMDRYNKALEIAKELEDYYGISSTIGNIGIVNKALGKYTDAISCLNEQLKIAQEHNFKDRISSAFGNLGIIYKERGDYDKAMENYHKKLKIVEELGDKKEISIVVGNMGIIYLEKGDLDKAMEAYQKKLEISKELGNKRGIALVVGNMGNVYFTKGDYDNALKYYNEQIEISEELGYMEGVALATGNMGQIYIQKQEYEKAISCYKKSLDINMRIGNKINLSIDYGNSGYLYSIMGKYETALEYINEAVKINEEIDFKTKQPYDLYQLSDVLFKLGKYDKAKESCIKSFNISLEVDDTHHKIMSSILLLKIDYVLLEDESEKIEVYEKLQKLTNEYSDKSYLAQIYYELYIIASDLNFEIKGKYREKALNLYKELNSESEYNEHEEKIKELSGD